MILFEKTGNCDKIRVWNYGLVFGYEQAAKRIANIRLT